MNNNFSLRYRPQALDRQMTPAKKSRRRFFKAAALGTVGLALAGAAASRGRSLLEKIADTFDDKVALSTNPNFKNTDEFDDAARDIASLIMRGINETRYWRGTAYKDINQFYNQALEKSRKASEGVTWEDSRTVVYKGLELIALMRQARMLSNAHNIIPKGEQVYNLNGIPIKVDVRLGSTNNSYNLFKALTNYEEAEAIWIDVLQHKKRFPTTLGIPQLRDWDVIADFDTIHLRMEQTLERLKELNPQYRQALDKKLYSVRQNMAEYKN